MPHPVRLPWPRVADDGTELGIDVGAHYRDIRKITIAHFGRAVHGLEGDEIVQLVVEAILRRNYLPSTFDPRKSSRSHYIFIVAQNAVRNAIATEKRARRVALLDAPELEAAADAHALDAEEPEEPAPLWQVALARRQKQQAREAAREAVRVAKQAARKAAQEEAPPASHRRSVAKAPPTQAQLAFGWG